jgi:hypothetical protein
MAKKINPMERFDSEIEKIVDALDMDGILYRLYQLCVRRRDKSDEEGTNPAESKYWQKMLSILSDAQEKAEQVEG